VYIKGFFMLALLLLGKGNVQAGIERIGVSSIGKIKGDSIGHPSLSDNGRFVAFDVNASSLVPDDTNERSDVFVKDRQTGIIERVSVSSAGEQGNGDSYSSALSSDGRYVAFYSEASNLVSGDTNGSVDTFVKDRLTGIVERVSVTSAGE